MAIAPNFHKDNFTDRKYHKFFFQFLQFKIIQNSQILYLHLQDTDTNKVTNIKIAH